MKRSFGVVPFSSRRRTPRGVIRQKGPAGLTRWLARAHPEALKKAIAANPQLLTQARAGLASIAPGAPSITSTFAANAATIANAVLPFLQLEAQRKLLKVQVKRAEQGLPPLDATSIDVPAARVQVDVEAGTKTRTGVMVALAGAGALVLWLLFGRRRRS